MCENPIGFRADTIQPTESAAESVADSVDDDEQTFVTVTRFLQDHGSVVTFGGVNGDDESIRLTVDRRVGADIFDLLNEEGEVVVAAEDWAITRAPGPKPEKVGTRCECGAGYVELSGGRGWGYACAR